MPFRPRPRKRKDGSGDMDSTVLQVVWYREFDSHTLTIAQWITRLNAVSVVAASGMKEHGHSATSMDNKSKQSFGITGAVGARPATAKVAAPAKRSRRVGSTGTRRAPVGPAYCA